MLWQYSACKAMAFMSENAEDCQEKAVFERQQVIGASAPPFGRAAIGPYRACFKPPVERVVAGLY